MVSRDHRSPALQGIIVLPEPCSPHSTNVPWARGIVRVEQKLKVSVDPALRAGTVWQGLDLRPDGAALDTTVLKVL